MKVYFLKDVGCRVSEELSGLSVTEVMGWIIPVPHLIISEVPYQLLY